MSEIDKLVQMSEIGKLVQKDEIDQTVQMSEIDKPVQNEINKTGQNESKWQNWSK